MRGGSVFLDFVTTLDRSTTEAIPRFDELSPGYANLLAWSETAGTVDPTQVDALRRIARKDGRAAAGARRRALDLREALHTIVLAIVSGESPDPRAIGILDLEIRQMQAAHQLAWVDGTLRNMVDPATGRTLDSLLWPIVRTATEVLGSARVTRIRRCAASECQTFFLDTTKNGSRRFCSTNGCGNVNRVRRFRARHAIPAEHP
jgi:predicted RNA-binding Zn ribbon-like protein